MHQDYIGLNQAREIVARRITPLPPITLPLSELAGMTAAGEVKAEVYAPSVTGSTKDGFAVLGCDLHSAAHDNPVHLKLVGSVAAGESTGQVVGSGQALGITTGAPLPRGADAVLASEFARTQGDQVVCLAGAEPGRNVMPKGQDIKPGQVLAGPGQLLSPGRVGLMAAGGCHRAPVHPLPRVGLLATGREVVAPGEPLPQGAVYASNLVELTGWLKIHGMAAAPLVADDDEEQIRSGAEKLLAGSDALLTSGGAWMSRRDLVVGVLMDMGMELIFRRVRMGPGKGVAFGLLEGKPVFCLPGGPPSNEMAFLQLALPGLLLMAGHESPGLPTVKAVLHQQLQGQADWTQFWHGRLEPGEGHLPVFHHFAYSGRLGAMAGSEAIIALPEGRDLLDAGEIVTVQKLGLAREM